MEQLFNLVGPTARSVGLPFPEKAIMNTSLEYPVSNEFQRRPDWKVDLGIAMGGILGYLFAWTGIICLLVLKHWMFGISGAVLGGLLGWIWYRLSARMA